MFQQVASVGLPPHNLARAAGSQAFSSRFTGFQLRHGSFEKSTQSTILQPLSLKAQLHHPVFFSRKMHDLSYTDRVSARNRGTSRL